MRRHVLICRLGNNSKRRLLGMIDFLIYVLVFVAGAFSPLAIAAVVLLYMDWRDKRWKKR